MCIRGHGAVVLCTCGLTGTRRELRGDEDTKDALFEAVTVRDLGATCCVVATKEGR